jgi:hypothetical protein
VVAASKAPRCASGNDCNQLSACRDQIKRQADKAGIRDQYARASDPTELAMSALGGKANIPDVSRYVRF